MQHVKPRLLHKISCSTFQMGVYSRACFTTDNRIIFCDQPIRVYDMASSSVQTIQTKFIAVDITCDLKNNIYGAFGPISINKIDIENMKLEPDCTIKKTRKINVMRYTRIRVNNDKLYSNYQDKIMLFNQDGTVVKSLDTKFNPVFMCVENSGGIFISDGKSIMHITESGEHNKIPNNMKTDDEIKGLDIDGQGKLSACICNDKVGSIVRINISTGYMEPILENLVTPQHITFHPNKNMFLVITDHKKECSVYQVTN